MFCNMQGRCQRKKIPIRNPSKGRVIMAYTIQILKGGFQKQNQVWSELEKRLIKSPFTAKLTLTVDAKGFHCIIVKPVRLRKAKPYCGNHPGECFVSPIFGPRKKPNATWLEWDDWVKFHALVNALLNRLHCHANVWSTPQDVQGKMWIRKDMNPRIRWDWAEEAYGTLSAPIRIWNKGTPDQFKHID